MIVITGALGHVGSKLIRGLDDELILIDNLRTQAYPSLFNLGANCKFIQADIMEDSLEPIFSGADCVVHLAAIADPENSFKQKEDVWRINYSGTERVARVCMKVGVPMIFASTTSVYGVQEDEVDETCGKLKPQTPYAETKIKSEEILAELGKQGLKYVTCRFGTIFGHTPGMRFHTAVNRFCFQAAFGQPITVWRTALNQNRPYLAIDDMIRAIQFIIDNKIYPREIYNVLTLNTTVGNIVDIIKESIPDLSINFVDSEIMSQLSYTISNSKFKSLGFEFKGDLEKGIKKTLSILRKIPSKT